MANKFPLKFKALLETERKDVEPPDYILLNYSVCGCFPDSCGWAGWTLAEGVYKITGRKEDSGTGDLALPSDGRQVCPTCGKDTFRTGATFKFIPSSDQKIPQHSNPIESADYDVSEMEYKDD